MGPEFAALVARVSRGGRVNVRVECARLHTTPKTFYKYLGRFVAEGVDGFYPRSRRPVWSPARVTAGVEDVIVRVRKELDDQGWDAGAEQIAFWIGDHPEAWPTGPPVPAVPSRATINRILDRRGQIVKVPQRRPRRSRHRFEADRPNSLWQMDGFDYQLACGRTMVILQLTDDCSRLDLALQAAPSENGKDAWATFLLAAADYGLPARLLTDNGLAFSGKRRGWISRLEENLHALNVVAITSSVGHPQTCGKNERAHSTVLKWLAKRPPARDETELQTLLDGYRDHYNHRRRKTHLGGMTPAERFALGPLDAPSQPGQPGQPWPTLIKTATVSTSGCIGVQGHLLGVGRRHAHRQVTVIAQHRQIAIFDRHQLIAEYTLHGHRGYQAKKPLPLPIS